MTSAASEPTGDRQPATPQPGVTVVVPLYRSLEHLRMVGESLRGCADELRQVRGRIVFIDDSPGHAAHAEAAAALARSLSEVVPTELLVNEANLGFVRSCNRGLEAARRRGDHALLLNSDTLIFPGAITEMRAGLEHDSMVAFVCPRSNNATICSLPTFDTRLPRPAGTPHEHARRHADIARHLPRFSYAPTAVGFCMLVRGSVLGDVGLLDEAYGRGYDEENDLVMRANRLGYRALLANQAFVYHEGTASFDAATRTALQARNSRILEERYPEYMPAVHQYLASAPQRGETILSERSLRSGQGATVEVAVDGRSLSHLVHGTSRLACRTVAGLARRARGSRIRVSFVGKAEVAAHHGLDTLEGLAIVPEEQAYGFDVWLKCGQPFSMEEFWDASRRGVHLAWMMLDTIAWDCLYLRTPELGPLWGLTADLADGIVFISPFTEGQFRSRFALSPRVRTLVAELSLDAADYAVPLAPAAGDDILVFGNHFEHKFVKPTAERLAAEFPGRRVVMFGIAATEGPDNLEPVASGTLTATEMEALYGRAACVVFPSTYEGFGLPVVESLGRGLDVHARDTSLNRWIGREWNGPGRLHLFATLDELVARLRTAPTAAVRHAPPGPVIPNGRSWDDIAGRVWEYVEGLASTQPLDQFWCRLDEQDRLDAHAAGKLAAAGPRRRRRTPREFFCDLPDNIVKEWRRFQRRRRERRWKRQ
jgi:GT2 family glycosyltransferase